MEEYMKENGKMTNNMEEHYLNYLMEKLHLENGRMEFALIENFLI